MVLGHKVWEVGHSGAVGCRGGLGFSGALRAAGGDMGVGLVVFEPVAWGGMRPGEGKLKGRLSRSPATEGKQLVLQEKSLL